MFDPLQKREIFHIEFLRWFSRKVKSDFYAVKGGVNLRFFFNSFRYSEDIDIDISNLRLNVLQDTVKEILFNQSFQNILLPYNINRIVPPDMSKAKQTETTQRFKVHLLTSAGEDLFTKIEFSRRGIKKGVLVQPISDNVLRKYKLPPLLIPHYNIQSTVMQKINAIASRSVIQARDIFDIYILSSQYEHTKGTDLEVIKRDILTRAYENIFGVSFEQFHGGVLLYLTPEDQSMYKTASAWDEVKLKTANFINEFLRLYE